MSAPVRITLLGGLRIDLGARVVEEADWGTRRAMELVAMLALADGRRLARERVIEALWPHLGTDAGAANLRKAAHHARRTIGDRDAVVLRGGLVSLLPDRAVSTDLDELLTSGRRALAAGDATTCAALAARHDGELLPTSPYEHWTQDARRAAESMRAELRRAAGDWEGVVALEPTDEDAARRVIETALEQGRRHHAVRTYERLRLALARELGRAPGPAVRALYDRATAGTRHEAQPLVGRADELARALAHLRSIAGGQGTGALLLRGPTGIGKSAVGDELMRRAQERGWRTLTVTATATAIPYAALSGLIEQLLADLGPAGVALPARTHRVLERLGPAAVDARSAESTVTRHQVVAALRRLLAAAGGTRPTVLRVEDAHLADEATADVLYQLVAGAGAEAIVVLAYRSEWLHTSLPRGVAELARAHRTLLIDLPPLADDELTELVRGAADQLDDQAVARVVAKAAGSPFAALELARGWRDHRGPLPQTVRDAILARLVDLDDVELRGLAALGIAEDDLDLASIVALTGATEADACALLDDAIAAGALVVAGARYRFRHELVRQALVDGLPEHRRLALHRAAAERLAAGGAEPALVARHLLQGGLPAAAIPHLLAAARKAMTVGAFADALRHVQRVLAEAPDERDGLVARAEILDALGDPRAPAAYELAATTIGGPDAQDLRARQALAQLKASDPESALRTLQGVTPVSPVGRLAAALTLSAAAAIGRYADHETAMAKAEEALALATELGDDGLILDATWAVALAAHSRGELPGRLRAFLETTRALPELATRVFDGQLCVTERMLYGGLPNDEIIAFADDLAAEAERLGAARGQAFALTLRGEATILAGRLEEADQDFAAGARLHGRIGAVAGEALSLLGRAQVAVQQGRAAHARVFLRDALVIARESDVGHHTLDRIFGTMVEAAEDPQEALAVVEQAETAIRGPTETCPTCRIAYVVPATIAAARAGDLERARRYAAHCERALEVVALPPAWHAAVDEARGHLALAEGRAADARAHFTAAADGFRAWGQPLDAERCALSARQ